jgi:hypothetical protein
MHDQINRAGSLQRVGNDSPSSKSLAAGSVSLGAAVTLEKATLATQRATLMYGCFRRDDAADADIFMDAAIAILADYPDDVIIRVTDPREGLPSQQKWPPQPHEVKTACEAIEGPRRRLREYNERTRKQLAERRMLEAQPAPRQTYEEFKAEMAARGMPIDRNNPMTHGENPDDVMKKYGITREQWNAVPDAPKSDHWEQLLARHWPRQSI